MTKARIAKLERQHEALEEEVTEALQQTSADDMMVAGLIRSKLDIREEIEQLRLRLILLNWNGGTKTLKRRSPKHCFKGRQTT